MSGPSSADKTGRTAFASANMVAEPGKVPAPAPSGHAMPWWLALVLLTIVTVDVELYQGNDVYYQENKEKMIAYTDLVTLEDLGEDWHVTNLDVEQVMKDEEELKKQWIGTTECARIGPVVGRELMTEGQCSQPGRNSTWNFSKVQDWDLDVELSRLACRPVGDRCSDFLILIGEVMVVSLKSYFTDVKNSFLDFVNPFLQEYGFYQIWKKVNEMIGWRAMCFLLFLVAYGVGLTVSQMRKCRRLASRRTLTTGHLGCYRQRRWNGRLRGCFEKKLQLRGLVFMTLWLNTLAMDQEQMNRLLAQVMTLADAATNAARTSSSVMERMEN